MEFLKKIWGRFILWVANFVLIDRADYFLGKFGSYLKEGTTLDLGCGTGHIGRAIRQKFGRPVCLLDVTPDGLDIGQRLFTTPCATTMLKRGEIDDFHLYGGGGLPCEKESFDNVLVAFVFHHVKDAEFLLGEAIRVVKQGGRVIILEDIPKTEKEAKQNRVFDSVVNLEFVGHPHNNRSEEEWLDMFHRHNLRLVAEDSWVSYLLKMPFPNTMFVLEK